MTTYVEPLTKVSRVENREVSDSSPASVTASVAGFLFVGIGEFEMTHLANEGKDPDEAGMNFSLLSFITC